jgi:hypothetical protein
LLGFSADSAAELQRPFDAAVIIPTILRPALRDALQSVFCQDIPGRIHVLVGIDVPLGDPSLLQTLCADRPPNCVVQVYYPGYSTQARHGGLSPARDGGVLRSVLSYLANSPFVAYLDDDNWWRSDHLRLLRQALGNADWAYSLRWFVHPQSRRPLCVDQWESVGPDRGLYRDDFGGFVDPSCLMINKLACEAALPLWNCPMLRDSQEISADRTVFDILHKQFHGACTREASVFYTLNPDDGMHALRRQLIGAEYELGGAC